MSRFLFAIRTTLRTWLTCIACCAVSGLFAQEPVSEDLPKLRDLPTPTAEALLHESPLDWIVLANDDVVIANTMKHRPLNIDERKSQIQAKELERARFLGEAKDRMTKELDDLSHLNVTLPDDEDRREFRLPVRMIKSVIHHEDLILKRVEILLQENQLPVAMELLSRMDREQPQWNGLNAMLQKAIEQDAQNRLKAGDAEEAFRLLCELQTRNPRYPSLQDRFDAAVVMIVESALQASELSKALHFLNLLQLKYPNDQLFKTYETRLSEQSLRVMQDAEAAFQQREFRQGALLAEQAVAVWPRNTALRAPYKKIADRYQRLHVGVTDFPGSGFAYPLPSDAELRRNSLTTLTLFELDRFRDGTAYYSTRFFDDWEPRDLERRMQFTLRQVRQPAERQAIITAPDVIRAINAQLNPRSPSYNDRLASYISSIEVVSPTQFSLVFRQVPPRIEPLLASIELPFTEQAVEDSSVHTDPGGFRVLNQTPDRIDYGRIIPEPNGLQKYHIAEIVEHRYDSSERVALALQRGEISVAVGLSDVALRRLQGNDDLARQFFIQKMAQPVTHLLQFNPASLPLKSIELRKALAYAVDREKILTETVLSDPQKGHGRLVTTPFASSNPGRNVEVAQRKFDLTAGLALAMTAQHKFKAKLPPLTMIVAPGEASLAAAEEIAQLWRRIGLSITVVGTGAKSPASWDILYRTLQMREPVLDIWPFLMLDDQAGIDQIRDYPDWLKQELLELDRAGNQTVAIAALRVLHRHLAEETTYIPLWEVDQFLVLRKNLQGFPQMPVHCYQNADRWTMDAWYQMELP